VYALLGVEYLYLFWHTSNNCTRTITEENKEYIEKPGARD
jgi:hypothetical protein